MPDPVKVDLPPLHPDRVDNALRTLVEMKIATTPDGQMYQALDSAIAALQIVKKSQRALNLTGDTATAIGKAQEFLAAIVKLTQR